MSTILLITDLTTSLSQSAPCEISKSMSTIGTVMSYEELITDMQRWRSSLDKGGIATAVRSILGSFTLSFGVSIVDEFGKHQGFLVNDV